LFFRSPIRQSVWFVSLCAAVRVSLENTSGGVFALQVFPRYKMFHNIQTYFTPAYLFTRSVFYIRTCLLLFLACYSTPSFPVLSALPLVGLGC
jgi:uncharacterized membrane protein YbhN (UPF0104 family)